MSAGEKVVEPEAEALLQVEPKAGAPFRGSTVARAPASRPGLLCKHVQIDVCQGSLAAGCLAESDQTFTAIHPA